MITAAKPVRRPPHPLLVAIALGLVTTVASAWIPSAFSCHVDLPAVYEQITHEGFTAHAGTTSTLWKDSVSVSWENDPPWTTHPVFAGIAPSRNSRTPLWSAAWLPIRPYRPPATWSDPTPGRLSPLTEVRTGWPFRALTCSFDDAVHHPGRVPPAVYPAHDAIALECFVEKYPTCHVYEPRALPLKLVWPGLAANTVLYSAVWFFVLVSPRGIRRAWRIKHQLCLACAYDLSGQTEPGCPECGSGRTSAHAPSLPHAHDRHELTHHQ